MSHLHLVEELETLKEHMMATMNEFYTTKEVNVFCITRGLDLNTTTFRALEMLEQEHKIDSRTPNKRNGGTQKLYRLKRNFIVS